MKKTYRVTVDIYIDPKHDKVINPKRIQDAILYSIGEYDAEVSYPIIQLPVFTIGELEELGKI